MGFLTTSPEVEAEEQLRKVLLEKGVTEGKLQSMAKTHYKVELRAFHTERAAHHREKTVAETRIATAEALLRGPQTVMAAEKAKQEAQAEAGVASANADAAEAAKAKAEAEAREAQARVGQVKAETEKAQAEAREAQAEANKTQAEATKAQADERKARAQHNKQPT